MPLRPAGGQSNRSRYYNVQIRKSCKTKSEEDDIFFWLPRIFGGESRLYYENLVGTSWKVKVKIDKYYCHAK